jgi:hypothetical protein
MTPERRPGEEITASRIIPSRRKTSSIPNLLHPDARPVEPALSEAEELERALAEARAEIEREATLHGAKLGGALAAARLPLSRPSNTDQTRLTTSKDYSGLIRRRPRRSTP